MLRFPPPRPLLLGLLLGLLAGLLLPPTRVPPLRARDPGYRAPRPSRCPPPPRLHERRPLHPPGCLTLVSAAARSLTVRARPPSPRANHTLALSLACDARALLAEPVPAARTLRMSGLRPDADYVLELRALDARRPPAVVCRARVATRARANFARNPGFEGVADPPFVASRFREAADASPRHWTPFYNGAARRVCGVVPGGEGGVAFPFRGRCCLRLGKGRTMWGGGGHPLFHGVHQAVQVPEGAVVVSAWYRLERGMGRFRKEEPESAGDALAMVLAWRGGGRNDDGLVVQLEEGAAEWRRVCARPEAIKGGGMLHVFFHLHDFEGGHLFVDDVKVEEEGEWSREALQACFRDAKIGQRDESGGGGGRDVRVHLKGEERPGERQLTLAIPLTSDRVLRLEALSRLYGGGPVSAAVAVESESDVAAFRAIWMRKEWLRRHVDVSFVRRGGEDEGQEPLEINALRNVAVQAAGTRFVMMADVDMTPATNSFGCFRDANNTWLEEMLPESEKRVLTVPVFISDAQHRPSMDKDELQNMLKNRAGTSYCLNSQRANKIKRWYRQTDATEVRALTDYEPYGIVRRDKYPAYDERFSGYGFNKISWAFGAEYGGWRLFLLPAAFLTHLNHVENDWVRSISVPHYLQTWRRFLAFAAETEGISGMYVVDELPPRIVPSG